MPATDRAAGVRRLVEPAVTGAGCVLEDVTITPAGRRSVVRVVVDLPDEATGSLDSDHLAAASRAVGAALDADDGPGAVLGSAPYVLEVSTPGVDRPLTERRHWSRARGRLVLLTPAVDASAGGATPAPLTGRVVAVDDTGVRLDVDGTSTDLTWEQLAGAPGRVQVEFSRPGVVEEPLLDGADDDTDDDDLDGDDLEDDEDEDDELDTDGPDPRGPATDEHHPDEHHTAARAAEED